MIKRSLPFLAASLILSTSITSLGWGPGGHMMVATIAYERDYYRIAKSSCCLP